MYKLVVAGGTFDLLHKGHKSFLTVILNQTERLILGLTSDNYVSQNKDGSVEDYEIRRKNLENFFESIGRKKFVEIVSIDDIYGPLLKTTPDAVAVTKQTASSIKKINEKRNELGLSGLQSIEIPMDIAEDGLEISSTRIRKGEINREGKLYFKKEWEGKNFELPQNLREELSKPFGEVMQTVPSEIDGSKIITVGDETTKIFNEKKIGQFLSIIDFKIHREKRFDSIKDLGFGEDVKVYEIKNPKGVVANELIKAIKEAFLKKERSVILIDGEDDLAVLPVLILSPLGYSIFYGQPNEGLVEVKVTLDAKENAYEIISSFEIT